MKVLLFFLLEGKNENKKDIMGISFGTDDRVDVFYEHFG